MSAFEAVTGVLRVGCFLGLLSFGSLAHAEQATLGKQGSVTSLMQQMVGTWQVQSKMWPAPEAKAIDLPPAIAHRELVAGAFLREVMQPAPGSGQATFERIAHFSYNTQNRQYEYFSQDTRLPQMMSYIIPGANQERDGKVELAGASFVAPEWGAAKNVPFMYRLTVGPVQADEQVLQLFLTEQNGRGQEFLAFEYVYRRQATPRAVK